MAGYLNTRVTSLEESMRRAFAAIESLSEHEKKLDDAMARMGRSFQQTRRLRSQADRGRTVAASAESPVQAQRDAQLSRQLDARIAKLIADIRKLKRNK